MPKYFFKKDEVLEVPDSKYELEGFLKSIDEEEDDFNVYKGPTIDELEAVANNFRREFENEKKSLLTRREQEAQEIVQRADEEAREITRQIRLQVDTERAEWDQIKRQEKEGWESYVEREKSLLLKDREDTLAKAFKEGEAEGRKLGMDEVLKNSEGVISRLHHIVGMVLDKRKSIFASIEPQVVELILFSVRKVVKVVTSSTKEVVRSNVLEALQRVKDSSEIIVRINSSDLDSLDAVKDQIYERMNKKDFRIVEDHTIDPGGCIVDTDFGSIDARISTQLHALEREIQALSPMDESGENL